VIEETSEKNSKFVHCLLLFKLFITTSTAGPAEREREKKKESVVF